MFSDLTIAPADCVAPAARIRNRDWAKNTNAKPHLIPLLLKAVVTGEPITIFGDDYDTPDGT